MMAAFFLAWPTSRSFELIAFERSTEACPRMHCSIAASIADTKGLDPCPG